MTGYLEVIVVVSDYNNYVGVLGMLRQLPL
jgi:hypothetical protein